MLQEVFCEVRRRSSCASAPQHVCPPLFAPCSFLGIFCMAKGAC